MEGPGTVVDDTRIDQLASGIGWFLIVLGLLVLAGWAFHLPLLTSVLHGLVTMKANTALAFLLAGLALLRRHSREAWGYSGGIFLLGAATLAEYVTGSNLQIDELLFPDPESRIDPGRMSQISAVALLLLGAALPLIRSSSSAARRVSRLLGWWVFAIGFIAILGYSYDIRALYQVQPYARVAFHTAVGFVGAGLAIQCCYPDEGVVWRVRSDSAGGLMLRRLLLTAILLPTLVGYLAWWGHRHLGMTTGFVIALVVAGTSFLLIALMLLSARHLEAEDLALRELNRELEHRVRDRTAALETEMQRRERMQEIVDAQRAQMIETSKLSALGEMAGGVAHEINSPLNIIQARADDLRDLARESSSVNAAQVRQAADSILATTARITNIVRGLRVFARDGRRDPFEATRVRTILDDVLGLCRERFTAYGINLELGDFSDALAVECQRVRISQVLLNLLSNAFDAVEHLDSRWVRVEVAEEPQHVQISVLDSGPGIPHHMVEKVMHPFFTTKPAGKGTGLGLSVSTAITQEHHGQLWVDASSPHSCLVLRLPKQHSGAHHDYIGEEDTVNCGRRT